MTLDSFLLDNVDYIPIGIKLKIQLIPVSNYKHYQFGSIKNGRTFITYYQVENNLLKEIENGIKLIRKMLKNNKDFYLNLIGLDLEKQFPGSGSGVLKPINVNSGVSLIPVNGDENGESLVFRKQEMLKVVLHETLHAMRFDIDSSVVSKTMEKEFKIKNPNEAATEALSTILALKIRYPKYEDFNKKYKEQLKLSNKMLNDVRPYLKGPEKTNVKAYFGLKTFYLENLGEFMENLEKNDFRITNEGNFWNWTRNLILKNKDRISYKSGLNNNKKNDELKVIKMTII